MGLQRWKRRSKIILEGSNFSLAVGRACRGARARGERRLDLTGNLALAAALRKNSAGHFGLNRVCRLMAVRAILADARFSHYGRRLGYLSRPSLHHAGGLTGGSG